MNFQSLLQKLESSEQFKKFKQENPQAYLCAGFFILDLQQSEPNSQDTYQIDFALPDGKIATFTINNQIQLKIQPTIQGQQQKLAELNRDVKMTLEEIKKIAKQKAPTSQKIITTLQNINGKNKWILNCTKGLSVVTIKIDDETKEVEEIKETNLMDIVKKP